MDSKIAKNLGQTDIPTVVKFTIPKTGAGSLIAARRWQGVYAFSPYVGMKPPPPLFGKKAAIFNKNIFNKPFKNSIYED